MVKFLKMALVTVLATAILIYLFIKNHPYSFLFAWVLNFALMIVVFVYTNTFNPRLKANYYNLRQWESDGNIYKWIGIDLFRKLLVLIGWERVIRAANPINKNTIEKLERAARESEFAHLLIFCIVGLMSAYVAFLYGFQKSLNLLILNILFNFYPVILQRYNRPRLQRAIRLQRT